MSDALPIGGELEIQTSLAALTPTPRQRAIQMIVAAALSSIPWVGGVAAAIHAFEQGKQQAEVDSLVQQWLNQHREKLAKLFNELGQLTQRLEQFGPEIEERLASEEYLGIVRKAFRIWDKADTETKRSYIVTLLTNAGASKLVEDDVVRLFLDWLDRYHESHFKVVREVYREPRTTRCRIWKNIRGILPREDSAEADLYRLLVDELSQVSAIESKCTRCDRIKVHHLWDVDV